MLSRGSCFAERWQFHCDGSVISVAATPNCSLIAAATVGRSLYLLSSDGKKLWAKTELDHEAWSCAISADGSVIAVGTANKNPADGSVYVFGFRGQELLTHTIGAPVWSLSLSPDGSVLVASSWNGNAYRFVRTTSRFALNKVYESKTGQGLYGIRLLKDGTGTVVGAYDNAVIRLNRDFTEQNCIPALKGVYNVAIADQAEVAVAGARNGEIAVYSLASDSSTSIKVKGCSRPVCGIAVSDAADLLVAGSFDGWVYLLPRSGVPLAKIETNGEVWSVACSDDAGFVCIGSGDSTVRLLENRCVVTAWHEIAVLEEAVQREVSERASHLERLVSLYMQLGIHQYGFTRLCEWGTGQPSGTDFSAACEDLLRNALIASDQNYWAHFELGQIAQQRKRHRDAISHFQQAAKDARFASVALSRCAESFGAKRLSTATASCYRRARGRDIDSDAKRVLYNLGRSYEDTKQWRDALSHYQLLASWDIDYRNTWHRLENLLLIVGERDVEVPLGRTDYTGITISLLGADAPREVDETLNGVLRARTAEVLIQPLERERVSHIVQTLRDNERFCRGITGTGLDYDQELFLKYDFALPEDETKKFLETVNLLFLFGERKAKRTLDIGSATGRYPMLMKWMGAEAYGVDIAQEAIDYANEAKAGEDWPKYELADAKSLPFEKPLFDLVTCMMGTFAHIPRVDQQTVVNEIYRVLSPGGCVAVSTWDLECEHLAYLSIYNEEQKDTIRKNCPSAKQMAGLLEDAGFKEIQVRPFCLLPQVVIYDLGIQNLRAGDIQLIAQADLAVRGLYPEKHGEMFIAFGKK